MKQIGLLSDTHGYLDEALFGYLENCDEIWHAGDIGTVPTIEALQAFKPTRMVFGNIDHHEIRQLVPEHQRFELEGLSVWMTHIGGYPPQYNTAVRRSLRETPPDLFICGHSHILRVMRDPAFGQMLYLNPGAAGREGFHHMRTALKFTLDAGRVKDMAVIELGKRGQI